MHARSLYLQAPRQACWHAEQLPQPGPDQVLVRTVAGAISIGTELPQYMGTEREGYARPYPLMTGYESLGVVVARGADVTDIAVGDRVLAFYGHRSAALVSAAKVVPIPVDIGDDFALLAILGCDVMAGIRKLQPQPGERVLVSGCGTLGLLAVWSLRALGVEIVDVIEPADRRRELAQSFGASRAVCPDDAAMLGDDYAVGLECSSRDAAFHTLQRALQPEGRLCVLADGNLEPLTLAPEFHMRELRGLASSDGWDYQQHAAWHVDTVRNNGRGVERIFDHHISAGDLPATFQAIAAGEINPVKVFVRY